jgi:hypothetical protein
MRRALSNISPAMVVALIALFVALGGPGYATSRLDTQTRVSGKAVASKAIRGPRGRRGPRGPRGFRGLAGAKGPRGLAGSDGTALGYAKVNLNGTVEPSESKGVSTANVTTAGPGSASYCFHNLPFTPHSLAATIDWNLSTFDSQAFVAVAQELPGTTGCPAGTQAMVGTAKNGASSQEPFYVIFT